MPRSCASWRWVRPRFSRIALRPMARTSTLTAAICSRSARAHSYDVGGEFMAQPFEQAKRSSRQAAVQWLQLRIVPVLLVFFGLIVLALFAYFSAQRALSPLESSLFALVT